MADKIGIDFDMKSFRKELNNEISRAAQKSMDDAGRFLLEKSRGMGPRDSGALMESGRYKVRKKSVRIWYGNKTSVRYAFDRHEQQLKSVRSGLGGRRVRHGASSSGSGSGSKRTFVPASKDNKWLERAAYQNMGQLEERMLSGLDKMRVGVQNG